jgi:hypothetical protein
MRPLASAVYVLPAVLVNAAIQVILVVPDPTASLTVGFLLGALASGLAALATLALIVATCVAPDGAGVKSLLRARGGRFALWTVGLAIVVVVGLILPTTLLGFLVLAVTPYLLIASMASSRNPLAENFTAIRRRPLGFLLRLLLTGLVAFLLFLLAVLTSFFITGWIATAITVTVVGLAVWWLTRVWTRAYERAVPATSGP